MQRAIRLALVLATGFGGCTPPAGPPPPRANEHGRPAGASPGAAQRLVDDLLGLMRQRLLVQHEVARFKWHARRPVTDARREQQLLDQAEARARNLGVDPGFAREFFRAQIRAGKLIQQADLDAWRRGGPPPGTGGPDLKALRLRIDALNGKLLQALRAAGPGLTQDESRRAIRARAAVILRGPGITAVVRQAACAPLMGS